jgi:membrane protein YqaA with SNARE-associated domain
MLTTLIARWQLFWVRLWIWFKARAHSAHARWWLFGISFIESIFFPIPVDPLMAAMQLAGVRRWVLYATIATTGSVLGAVVGYFIGYAFYDTLGAPLVAWLGIESQINETQTALMRDAFGVTFLGALTPLPFKVFVLGAGFFNISFVPFLLASILGRTLRLFVAAYLVHRFGTRVLAVIRRYSLAATVASFAILILLLGRHYLF